MDYKENYTSEHLHVEVSIKAVFDAYCCGTQGLGMDGRSFAKLAKDCKGMLDKNLSPADVDLAFARVKKSPAERKINFEEFIQAVEILAGKKGVSTESLCDMIA
jgi:hypothetical protein